ncbi:centrosomal protein of 162 kDa isoform X2 [Brienomyrus brachyistius]|uniref:centrosomal protein of 162 kDa isoform X2 n=1 Tax=Brienomyrus brachyistius TaxID=42636 RepID=UPI0020B2AA96|nr:centrosomal protein of 162 kDa isoform X2 [Brienomyrus brachyistius]
MSHRLTKKELDDQFELFLKESISDDSVDLGGTNHTSGLDSLGKVLQNPANTTGAPRPWWNEDEETVSGLLASGKIFRKSQRKSQSIQEEDEVQLKPKRNQNEPEKEEEVKEEQAEPVIFSRYSFEPKDSKSVLASGAGPNVTGFGLDTLDEEKEKAHFFANLERGASSTIDYSKLNRELDSTGSTFTNTLKNAEKIVTELESKKSHEFKSMPATLNYSEDFEDELGGKEAQDEKISRPGMLAKVSFHDSLDSAAGTQKPEEGAEAADMPVRNDGCLALGVMETSGTAQSYGQSGASEVEALQEAYRQIDLFIGDSADHVQGTSSPSNNSHPVPAPEYSRGTFKATICTESDLPTAEELMRLIRPDLSLTQQSSQHPVIGDSTGILQGYKIGTSAEALLRGPAGESAEDPPLGTGDEKHRNIMEEVKLIMQGQDGYLEPRHPQLCKTKKKQVPGHSSVQGRRRDSSFPSQKKSDVPQVENKRALPGSPSQANAGNLADRHAELGLTVSDELVSSVRSSATSLQQHVQQREHEDSGRAQGSDAGYSRQPEVNKQSSLYLQSDTAPPNCSGREMGAENAQDCPLVDRPARKQKQFETQEEELILAHKREVLVLKQENYILQTKLHYLEEVSKKGGWSIGKSSDPITNEKLKLIEKELKEQETLIQGYHQENEKLYHQVKALKSQSKENEEAMFMVNQRLQVELAMAREEIKRSCMQRTAGNSFEQNMAISDQVQALQESEARLTEEIRWLKQEKQALEVDVGMVRKEMDSGDKNFDIKMLEEQHKMEVQALNRRLQWYTENHEMLDSEVGRLRAATEETRRLKEQVDKLKDVVGQKNSQEQKKVKERMADAKRILDLERQVKEMEDILKRRHPNSLPALIWAAASAAGPGSTEQAGTVSFLERRVHRLEEELEAKDEEAKQSLRAMEQQYHKIKIQYEQHISELEEQLRKEGLNDQTGTCKDWESKARALEQELQSLQETQKKQVSALRVEVDALQDQVKQSGCREQTPKKSPSKHDHQAEMAKGLRIKSLTLELAAKTKTVQDLTRTVERLQRERRSLLSVSAANAHSKEPKEPVSAAREISTKAQTFPVTLNEKSYQPLTFSGSHISEVLQENDHLKACLQHMELKNEQERVAMAQVEKELHRVRKDAAEQLSLLKTEFQRERESLIAQHALEHSSSKVAELTNQLSTQEIIIRHLQEEVKELQGCKEVLAVSHIREETLQKEMEKLLKELKEAKETHTPQLKHFTFLETKIKNMEMRHRERERELQQVIAKTLLVSEEHQQQQEVEALRKLAQGKTRELENFRTELDSILGVLRELQKQGVVIPVNGAVHLT